MSWASAPAYIVGIHHQMHQETCIVHRCSPELHSIPGPPRMATRLEAAAGCLLTRSHASCTLEPLQHQVRQRALPTRRCVSLRGRAGGRRQADELAERDPTSRSPSSQSLACVAHKAQTACKQSAVQQGSRRGRICGPGSRQSGSPQICTGQQTLAACPPRCRVRTAAAGGVMLAGESQHTL